jgi:hypothetical protein
MTNRILAALSLAIIAAGCARQDITAPSSSIAVLPSPAGASLIGRFDTTSVATSEAIGAPTNLVATVTGTSVSLAWNAPADATAGTTYLIEVGGASGLSNFGRFPSFATSFAGAAPNGTYYVRIRAVDAQGVQSQQTSNEAIVTVTPSGNPDLFFAPANPANGRVGDPYFHSFCGLPNSNGANCSGLPGVLSGGVPPYHFQLDTAGGFPPIGVTLAPNGALTGTPSGAVTNHAFKVCAVDTTGVNRCPTVTITIAPRQTCTAPAAPTGMTATANGTTLTVSWTGSAGATSYILEVGTASGAANAFSGDIGGLTSMTVPNVALGTYYFRVRAKNGCGESGASNEASVTIRNTTTPPPTGNPVSNILIWLTGCGGRSPALGGLINCTGYITMDLDADIRTGWIQVIFRFPEEGSFYNGQLQVGTGRIRRNVRVDIRNSYVSGCPPTPYNSFVSVADGRQGIDPGSTRIATVDVVIPNCS